MMASGRHSIAKPAPSISPPAREKEPRYSMSLTAMQRPNTVHVPRVNSVPHEVATGPGTYTQATTIAMNTLTPTNR